MDIRQYMESDSKQTTESKTYTANDNVSKNQMCIRICKTEQHHLKMHNTTQKQIDYGNSFEDKGTNSNTQHEL